MSQNIFDNDIFFDQYLKLRQGKNYNDLLEQPAMSKLLPDVKGLAVLDIGCGYGKNCISFAKSGARRVVGIDLSEKMLGIAKQKSSHPVIKYLRMDMKDISAIQGKFDLVYSSLTFHYCEDLKKLAADVYNLLNIGGRLLFSQEHPIVTATIGLLGHYNTDSAGNSVSYTFSDYAKGGKRSGKWFVDDVENYHRTMGEIVTTLTKAGFIIEDLVEPLPDESAVNELESLKKEFIKPTFLILKAKK